MKWQGKQTVPSVVGALKCKPLGCLLHCCKAEVHVLIQCVHVRRRHVRV